MCALSDTDIIKASKQVYFVTHYNNVIMLSFLLQ